MYVLSGLTLFWNMAGVTEPYEKIKPIMYVIRLEIGVE